MDSFVPYAGPMEDNLNRTLAKVKSTMISCGSKTIREFQEKAILTIVSSTSIIEGGAHDLISRPTMD